MRMNLSVDEIEWLIFACQNHEYESATSCTVGLKLISHLPVELQKEYKNVKAGFNQTLTDLEVAEHHMRCQYPDM